MKRVAFIIPWAEALGGAEKMLLTILRHLDPSRIEPSGFFLHEGPFECEVAHLGVRTDVVFAGRLRDAGRFWHAAGSLARLLDDLQPHVVCAWAPMAHLHSVAGRSRRRHPRSVDVWWQHGIPHGEWLDRLATVLPSRAIGCSSYAAAEAQRATRPRRETFVVHPGTEPRENGPTRQTLRKELGIPEKSFVVGITGRLQPWKNQNRVLDAIAALRREAMEVSALLVGGTAHGLSKGYASQVDGQIQELGLGAHVIRTGHVPDARLFLPAMDVLVNASEGEPFGIVLIEAMAAGLPVVAVDRGGPAEIVANERSGLLIPSSDPQNIAHALRRLAGDPALRVHLGTEGRRRYKDHFTPTRVAGTFAAEMERLSPS